MSQNEVKEVKEVKYRFKFDQWLMYHIQDVTKKSTVEIIAFFADLGKAVAIEGLEKRSGTTIRKKIDALFPGSSIPFHLLVTSNVYRNWDPHLRAYSQHEVHEVYIFVGFPADPTYMSSEEVTKIQEALLERDLLGGSDVTLPPFEQPKPQKS